MRTLKYFLEDETKHKVRVYQLDFIGVFLQAKVKNRLFVNLDSGYTYYFPEYSNYFGRDLRLLMSMYGMTNSGNLFADDLKEWLLEGGFILSQFQMSIYYNYAPDVSELLYYLMLITVSIGILLKLLGNGLWII